ncbi:c1f4d27d-47c0-482e-9934-b90de81a66e4 [Thermothielavioides terrestris]|uniref:C1f4d27d-47c0-482e-9934-b90de81a66e4 n=1 Tax=Thermothielavioides terrestris TaxID=2587410 RepID=A0A3S4C924_9PEZI|nr:c1f4d27d-47c0-482e-9934-b90de81a66e4 [Thermothielavioides terrestris]
MGRTKPSSGLPPAAFRKDARAKKAKATINKVIPALLSAHPRAREGINRSELITPDLLPPRPLKPAPTRPGPDTPARNPPVPRITLRITDTLTAAHSLLRIATPPSPTPAPTPTPTITPNPNPNTHTSSARRPARYLGLDLDLTNRRARVAILNMASPLCPGGGFLRGAAS